MFLTVSSMAQNFPKSNDFKAHERFVDIDTVSINLKINPYDKSIDGKSRITFVNLKPKVDSFFIHAVNFNLKTVLLNGKNANYRYLPKGGMWIYPDANSEKINILEIQYSATPRKGLFFVGWDDKTNRRNKQIWTQGQGIDNRYWFPSYDLQDEKSIYDILVSFPKEYNLLASGELLSKEKDSLNIKWHYQTKHPMSSYLVMLAGGEYNFKVESVLRLRSGTQEVNSGSSKLEVESVLRLRSGTEKKEPKIGRSKLKVESQQVIVESQKLKANSQRLNNIDFQYWYYTGEEEKVEPTYRFTEEIMSFFENEIGIKYPWDKYAQIPVSDFKHGAMENTEATIFSDTYFCNDTSFIDQNYISVNAHEMAHQWFGDALTCSSSKHHWLHEGFATFYQLKVINKFIGEEAFLWEKKLYRDLILKISRRDSLPLAHPKAGTERFYYKGSFVLMMLEEKLGEENFKKAIKKYTEDNLFGVVETETLKNSFEVTLDVDLSAFFNQWVYGHGEPQVEINYFEKGRKRGLEIKHVNAVFDFEIPITTIRKNKKEELLFRFNSLVDTLYFNRRIDFFEVDSNIESLADYKVNKPQNQWKEQVLKGSTSYSRTMAVKQLSKLSEKDKLKLYSEINLKKENHKVLAEVYSQLKDIESATDLRMEILSTKDVVLIKDIISITKNIDKSEREYFEEYLDTKSYQVISSSLDLLCESFPEKLNIYLDKTKGVSGSSIPFVRLSWLKNAVTYGDFSNSEKQKYANELVDFTSGSFGFNTRLLALNRVFEIQYFNRQLLVNLINGSVSFNHHLVGPYRQVMKEFAKNESFHNELNLILEEGMLNEAEDEYLRMLLGN